MKRVVIFAAFFCGCIFMQAQDITGQWNSILSFQGVNLRLVFHISQDVNGYVSTMDSPDQGANGIPVATTEFDGLKLSLTVPNIRLSYNGEFKTDSIVGIFQQGSLSTPMTLMKTSIETKSVDNFKSAENVEAIETEIVLRTSSGDLFASILMPENDLKDIVVLFICGSGPTDRNGNNPQMSNNSIRFLAEDLSMAGIPSVRYDKRGIAASTASGGREEDLRFSNYVDDARSWIDLLSRNYKRVIVVGHSEGAQIGVLASIDNPKVEAVVTIAGVGRKLDEVLKNQLADQSATLLEMAEPFIENLKNGHTVSDVPPILSALFRPSVQPYIISWFATDPAAEIAKLTVPVLIIQGETDIQVLPEDAVLLQKAQPHAILSIIPNMNHIFKECSTKDRILQVQTYMNPNLKNIPALCPEIVGFIESVR